MHYVMSKLKEYKEKRDFKKTNEPKGGKIKKGEKNFVIHDHFAKKAGHHHDLRLQVDGVLRSWAVPKGVPTEKGKKVLAVETEDHPLGYFNFKGEIPEGEYGAGKVDIFDKGEYNSLEIGEKKITVELEGDKVKGEYALIRFKKAGDKHWLLFKK